MKNIIYYISWFCLALLIGVVLFSCHKIPAQQEMAAGVEKIMNAISPGDSGYAYNAVILSLDQKINPADSGSRISASAIFRDSATGNMVGMGGLSINGRFLTRKPDSTFLFSYSDSSAAVLTEGQSLAGTMVRIKTTGISPADTVSQVLYMPKTVLRYTSDWPIVSINVLNNQTITWVPDPANPTGQIMIKVWYTAKVSRFLSGDNTLPTTDRTLTYTVADNGSYTIPTADLQGFKANSYIWISLGRGDQVKAVLPISHQNVYYFTASSGSTNAMFVQCAANWQNTTTALRCKAGSTTGEQEQEQRDLSVCSSTYNQTRWVVAGTNTTACPLCNSSNCSGTNHKCINGVCETGYMAIISQRNAGSPTKCIKDWGYFFSDGSYKYDHSTTVAGSCPLP